MAPTVDKLYIQKKLMKKNFFLTKKQLTTTRPQDINPNFYYRPKPKPKTRSYEHHEHPRQSHSQRRRSQEH